MIRVVESEKVDFHPDLGKVGDENNGIEEREDEEISIDLNEFLKFVEDGDKPLWPGNTKTTKMNATIELFNLKAKHGMSDHCYSDMLMMIAVFLPEDNVEDLETLPSNLPLPLEDLCKWADSELKNERTINTTLGPEFLGHSRKVAVSRKDIYNMADKQELSSDVLVCYISYLHGELQKSEMLDMVAFVDPDFTGALGCGNPTDRAKFLSNRYKQGKPGQIFFGST